MSHFLIWLLLDTNAACENSALSALVIVALFYMYILFQLEICNFLKLSELDVQILLRMAFSDTETEKKLKCV